LGGNWLLEASEVFELELADLNTGACPNGDTPIYRVFNDPADVSHRCALTIAERDRMVARGYIAASYGPNAVMLCGLSSPRAGCRHGRRRRPRRSMRGTAIISRFAPV